jgi:hypothetical protein
LLLSLHTRCSQQWHQDTAPLSSSGSRGIIHTYIWRRTI